MKKWLIGTGILALVALLAWANLRNLGSAGGGEGIPVKTQVMEPKDLSFTVLAPATLSVMNEYEVRSEIQSPTIMLQVSAGDRVTVGEELAWADFLGLDQAVVQAESNLAAAQSALAQLRRQAETAPEQARQQVAAAEVALQQAEAALARTEASLATQRQQARARLAQAQAALEQARTGFVQGQTRPEDLEAALWQVRSAEADLAALDPEQSPQLQEARLQVESARLRLAEAKLAARTAAVLPEQIQAAEAQVEAAEVALGNALADREKATFRSPVDGTVLMLPVKEGQPVTPGTLIAVVAPTDTLKAVVRVDEMEIGKVRVDQPATITTPAYPDETFTGSVLRIDPLGERSSTGTATVYPVEVEVAAAGKLRPNMNVDAEIITETRKDALALPLEALQTDDDGQWYVWLVRDGRAARVQVTPGLRTRVEVEIREGLAPGDEVVVGPLSSLKTLQEGQRLKPERGENPS